MILTLPWPPSTNTYWRHVLVNGRPRTLLSARARAYARQVRDRLLEQAPGQHYRLGDRLAVTIEARPPDRRARDLDNLAKATLDALQKAGLFESDAQVDLLTIRRAEPDKPLGCLLVSVDQLGQWSANETRTPE